MRRAGPRDTLYGNVQTTEPSPGSVEAVRQVLDYLVRERRRLRASGAEPFELEANRKAIAAMESHLGRAVSRARAVSP
jgi:hypothetical protein